MTSEFNELFTDTFIYSSIAVLAGSRRCGSFASDSYVRPGNWIGVFCPLANVRVGSWAVRV
jgi:hypothetical protein